MADTTLSDAVDTFLEEQRETLHIPGLSLAVVRSGDLVKSRGYGFANLELSVAATSHTVYQLASVSKQFVAAAIMLLIEQGALEQDAEVGRFLNDLPSSWHGVTLRHLLSHTSGLRDYENEPTINERLDYTDTELILSLSELPLKHAPGAGFWYSNTNFHLLGMVIQKVTGKPYDIFCTDSLFTPSEMRTTQLASVSIIPARAAGYRRRNNTIINGDYLSPTVLSSACAGFCSTVLDLARWEQVLYAESILDKAMLDIMWTPTRLSNGVVAPYGLGWEVEDYRGFKVVFHPGRRNTGFTATICRFLNAELTIILLMNLYDGVDPQRIAKGVAGIYDPTLRLPGLLEQQPDSASPATHDVRDFLVGYGNNTSAARLAMTPEFLLAAGDTRKKLTAECVTDILDFAYLGSDHVEDRAVFRHGRY